MSHQDDLHWAAIEYGMQEGFTPVHTDDGIVVTGICPRCEAETRWTFPNVDVEAITSVTVICACGYPHKDRPADAKNDNGCGAFWKIKAPS